MSAPKPTILFVPGLWHMPSCFDVVRSQLEKLGYQTAAVAHPSVGAVPPTKVLDEDAAHLRAAIESQLEKEENVVLLVHSYGGCVSSNALKGGDLNVATRKKAGKKGGVICVVYLSAFVVPKGKCLKDMLGGKWPPWVVFDDEGYSTALNPENIFYHDMSEADQKIWISRLKHSSAPVFTDPTTYEPWNDGVATFYIYCEDDQAIPIHMQKIFAATLGEGHGEYSINCSHSPFLSVPDELTEACVKAAEFGMEKAEGIEV